MVDNRVLLLFVKVGMHRQAQNPPAYFLGNRKLARPVLQRREGLLQMKRLWIINRRRDTLLLHVLQ